MVITGRCALGQSYTNPCKMVMSILNIGLQNCSTERGLCDENIEKELKKCNSMDAIRKSKDPIVKESWLQSIYPVQKLMEGRLERLQLKDEPINCTHPVKDYEVRIFQCHLKELFPTLDTAKLQKAYTSKNEKYMQWKSVHCNENHYLFQVRKCSNRECCTETRLPREQLLWLPSPLVEESGQHFVKYEWLKASNVSDEKDRPSLKVVKSAKEKVQQKDSIPGVPIPEVPKKKHAMQFFETIRCDFCSKCLCPRKMC